MISLRDFEALNDLDDDTNILDMLEKLSANRPMHHRIDTQRETVRYMLDKIAPYIDLSHMEVQEIDTYGDLDEEFSEIVVVREELPTTIPPLRTNESPIQVAFLNTMATIGLSSPVFKSVPKFHPFCRQHRVVSEVGPLYESERAADPTAQCDLIFPSVGFEFFSNQFKANTGIYTSTMGVVAANSVGNVIYDFRCLPHGPEFVVFRAAGYQRSKYFLWDDRQIVEVDAESECYGIRKDEQYYVVYGTSFSAISKNVAPSISLPRYYVTELAVRAFTGREYDSQAVRGLLLNVNGVDYLAPTRRWVCLQRTGNDMTDIHKKKYPVDVLTEGFALYEIGSCYSFFCNTVQRPDSCTSIVTMRDAVMTVHELVTKFKIPRDIMHVQDKVLTAHVVSTRQQFLDADRNGLVPFFVRSNGMSKNAAVGRYVQLTYNIPRDIRDYSNPALQEMYIGNNYIVPANHYNICIAFFRGTKLTIYKAKRMATGWIALSKEGTLKDNIYIVLPWDRTVLDTCETYAGSSLQQVLKENSVEYSRRYEENLIDKKKKAKE